MDGETASLCFTSPPYGPQRDYADGGVTDWDGRLEPSFEMMFHFNRQGRKPSKIVPCKYAGQDTHLHADGHSTAMRKADGSAAAWPHAGQPTIASQVVAQIRRRAEAAMGHAAFGGIAITSFLSDMAANSAMPSICMYRLCIPQSSLISSKTAPMRRMMASLLGKIQTTSVRRLTSLCNFFQWVGAVRFGPAPCGKIHVGERVILAGVHESAEPGVKGAIAIAPGLKSGSRRCAHDARRSKSASSFAVQFGEEQVAPAFRLVLDRADAGFKVGIAGDVQRGH